MNLRELFGKISGKPSSEVRVVLRQAVGEFLGSLGASQVQKVLAKNSEAKEGGGEGTTDEADLREQVRAFFAETTKGVAELTAAVRKELEKDERELPEDVRAEIFRDLRMMPPEETGNLMERFGEAQKRRQGARFLRCLSTIQKDEDGNRRSDFSYLNGLSEDGFQNAMAVLAGFSRVQEVLSGAGEKLSENFHKAGGQTHQALTDLDHGVQRLAEKIPGPPRLPWQKRRN